MQKVVEYPIIHENQELVYPGILIPHDLNYILSLITDGYHSTRSLDTNHGILITGFGDISPVNKTQVTADWAKDGPPTCIALDNQYLSYSLHSMIKGQDIPVIWNYGLTQELVVT